MRFYTEGARTQVHTVLDGPKGPPAKVVGNMPVSSDGSGIAEWNIDRIMEKIKSNKNCMQKAHNISYTSVTNMFLLHFLYMTSILFDLTFVANRQDFISSLTQSGRAVQ